MVLKTKFDTGVEIYINLGSEFNFVDKESAPEDFLETARALYGKNWPEWQDECYGFIICNRGSKTHPLYRGQENHILNDNGGIFKNVCAPGFVLERRARGLQPAQN